MVLLLFRYFLLVFVVKFCDLCLVLLIEVAYCNIVLFRQRLHGIFLVLLELICFSLELVAVGSVKIVKLVLMIFLEGSYLILISFLHFLELTFVIFLHISSFLLQDLSLVFESFPSFLQIGLKLLDLLFILTLHVLFVSFCIALELLDYPLVFGLLLVKFLFFLLI